MSPETRGRFEEVTDSPWFDVAAALCFVLLMVLAVAGVVWVVTP